MDDNDCTNGPVECAMTDGQLQTASQLWSVEGPRTVWVRDAGYSLVAVRHYVKEFGREGYRTSLVAPDGAIVYIRGVGLDGRPEPSGLRQEGQLINVVFDGPPGPVAPGFVEIETPAGKGLKIGEWKQRKDGRWVIEMMVICEEAAR